MGNLSIVCRTKPGLALAAFLSFRALMGLGVLVLFSFFQTSGLSGTYTLGAEILIGMACSICGTSFLGFITHASGLLTATSAFEWCCFFQYQFYLMSSEDFISHEAFLSSFCAFGAHVVFIFEEFFFTFVKFLGDDHP